MPESDSRWEQTDLLCFSLVTPDFASPKAAAEPLQAVAEREAEAEAGTEAAAAAAEAEIEAEPEEAPEPVPEEAPEPMAEEAPEPVAEQASQTDVAQEPEVRPDATAAGETAVSETAAGEAPVGPSALCVDLPSFTSSARSLPVCPQRLLILDTETTGLSPSHGQCIEVGAVLFHVPSRSVLTQVSFLLPCPSNPAQAINGIDAAVSRLPQPWQEGLRCFEAMVASADALVAHNAAFDRQWFGFGALPPLEGPWICSMEDIRWPADRQLRPTPALRDLALAYGVPVWAAHRALTDCLYLVQVFERCGELEELLQAALEPRRLYRARLSYAERHRAKAAGFRWNDPVQGAWTRRLSQRELEALTFPVQAVEADEVPLLHTA
jgi:DNA polymerase-3 subunit epsilon